MNEDRNQDRFPRQQAKRRHPDPWDQDLNPKPLAGQNIGPQSEAAVEAEWTAFHLRKRVPILSEGERLQQGATYVDLKHDPSVEFTARADMTAGADNAYAPKDRVPYEVWNRLIGEPKPGQE